jgi:hypothetical protein
MMETDDIERIDESEPNIVIKLTLSPNVMTMADKGGDKTWCDIMTIIRENEMERML